MSDPIEVVPYQPEWGQWFTTVSHPLRAALGNVALRIDHVGSTAVPHLAAKPVLDIQISVQSLEPVALYRQPLEAIGYLWRADNPDLSKRYFREQDGRRQHIHVREAGSWAAQFNLLFRDYLRAHPDDAQRYAAVKQQLAAQFRANRAAYTEGKSDIIWDIMRQANGWSQDIGWRPPISDA